MHTTLLLLVTSIAYFALVLPLEEDDMEIETKKIYSRYIDFPDGDGILHDVDLEAEPDYDFLTEIEKDPANNRYLLFTIHNNNSAQNLVMNNVTSIRTSNYNSNVPTVVIAHGWFSDSSSDLNPMIRNAFLERSDVNVIILDWSRLSHAKYTTVVRGVPAAGRSLGHFIRFLINAAGGDLNHFHFVGFSLGAHLVGNAGRELERKVARITGLDPAGPLWNTNSNKLTPNDAVYVEAIHTSVSSIGYGIRSTVARVDFFPNGGNSHQPGCMESVCDHSRAWELFASTVTNNHLIGAKCTCFYQMFLKKCCGATLNMGNDNLSKFGIGIYRLDTAMKYPF